jgi:Beta-lactamase superfamily domain
MSHRRIGRRGPVGYQLKTFGHATLVLLYDGEPIIATDPWLVGSTYWRSWWLEKYPSREQIQLVREAREIYITHSHPDHFHFPSLRLLGKRSTIHPYFPRYSVPEFLVSRGFATRVLEPWRWYPLAAGVRMASIPAPVNDSVLLLDTPEATIVDINDCAHRPRLLKCIRDRMLTPGKRLIALRSYSPASISPALFVNGQRAEMKTRGDYAAVARNESEILRASHFVPFASQASFGRTDSRWANDYKVTYEDLQAYWGNSPVTLCKPFIDMDLSTAMYASEYDGIRFSINEQQLTKVREREAEEREFELPRDFDAKLKTYLDEIPLLGVLYRRGIGWRLPDCNQERFYSSRRREIRHSIPDDYDFTITVPSKVLYEALCNNVLTDLGITMFIRVDTKTNPKLTYGAFLLMGLHDYGYFRSIRDIAAFLRFYTPYFEPGLMRIRWRLQSVSSVLKSPAIPKFDRRVP